MYIHIYVCIYINIYVYTYQDYFVCIEAEVHTTNITKQNNSSDSASHKRQYFQRRVARTHRMP